MVDIVDRQTRSRMMSGIRGGHTRPERRVRSFLHRAGLRFRLHPGEMPGKPDLVLKKYNTAIFVHGCFWHRHLRCKFAYTPKSNVRFWKAKFAGNVARDRKAVRTLRRLGWNVLIVWECDLEDRSLRKLVRSIKAARRRRS